LASLADAAPCDIEKEEEEPIEREDEPTLIEREGTPEPAERCMP
jgi:hypothetical protein